MYMGYLSSEGTKARLVRSQAALQETKCGDSNNQLQTAQQSDTVQSHLLNVLEDYCCAVDKQIGLEYTRSVHTRVNNFIAEYAFQLHRPLSTCVQNDGPMEAALVPRKSFLPHLLTFSYR